MNDLEEKLAGIRGMARNLPFQDAIRGYYGVEVLKFNSSIDDNKALISKLENAFMDVGKHIKAILSNQNAKTKSETIWRHRPWKP